ncbi:hypothetical protein CYY_000334 [Polysphondylium violaceum]|uniref:Uncharacterized protein n=1 Tax=Polysphondylium violaceum TaxID=133409 RepID=A0A8J4Q300_9MYCE|nr:hypothetical protein CYY_000334 [Polysphondylium violaceum]
MTTTATGSSNPNTLYRQFISHRGLQQQQQQQLYILCIILFLLLPTHFVSPERVTVTKDAQINFNNDTKVQVTTTTTSTNSNFLCYGRINNNNSGSDSDSSSLSTTPSSSSSSSSTNNDSSNSNYYNAEPSQNKVSNQNSSTYLPDSCEFLINPTDKDKLSCCKESHKETFNHLLEYIQNKSMGKLYSCKNENKTFTGGFKIVDNEGNTPDLKTDSRMLEVLDTRFHVKTCIDHLKKLQCFRCSQDHQTILHDPLAQLEYNSSVEPIFLLKEQQIYFNSSSSSSNSNSNNNNSTNGKFVTLCTSYFQQLRSYCQYITFRDLNFNQLFLESQPFLPGVFTDTYGIRYPPVTKEYFYSVDMQDGVYVSNVNCFKIPIVPFTEPTCAFIVNNTWVGNYDDHSNDQNSNNSITLFHRLNFNLILIISLIILLI